MVISNLENHLTHVPQNHNPRVRVLDQNLLAEVVKF